ncbi:MAG: sulfotransferase [Hyphomicrobiales bacterium]|nr:sulfotransferase [Hyphomicrobiales bacterium]
MARNLPPGKAPKARHDPEQILRRAQEALNRDNPAEAEPLLRRIVTRHRDSRAFVDALVLLGRLLQAEGRVPDSLRLFEQEAARWRGRDPHVKGGILTGLCAALAALGRGDEVAERCRAFLADHPGHPNALLWLATARGVAPDSAEAAAIEGLLAGTALPPPTRARLGFAYADTLDRAGRFDAAFDRYAAANAVYRAFLAANGQTFDPHARDREIDAVIAAAGTPPPAPPAAGPAPVVFVVGLPRSGTSLTEQILASHPAVHGAGESPAIPRLVDALRRAGMPYPGGVGLLNPDQARHLAGQYMGMVGAGAPGGAATVTDKLPDNVLHLNLIARLVPGARVVHCRRDPRDVGLSCFFQMFQEPHPWAYDLAHVGRFVRAHERLAAHWAAHPPLPLLDLAYADLVADTEAQVRRLLAFCGLDWDPACLDFHRSTRAVATASALQVREPIHDRSVGRWRHYAAHIGPLLDALAD